MILSIWHKGDLGRLEGWEGNMQEDKQKTCDALLPLLRETNHLYNLIDLTYDKGRDMIYAQFAPGNFFKVVDVSGISGIALAGYITGQIII